ncbi:MAG: YicC family protein [Candidatus Pelagadaptatus aseana]|uniref:YicC/YloC family endoribonuclease n=1 Tax=Candidatus Pelagadaptatus aseana TaxID=3120508 RepID=UPI0039B2DA3C
MPSSMTGFSRQEAQLSGASISWEVRSVNHRYLEPNFRLPDIARELEPQLRNELRKALSRGKLEVAFNYQLQQQGSSSELALNQPLVAQLAKASEQLSQSLSNPAQINPVDLLRWPGVIVEQELDRDELLDQALSLFKHTLKGLLEHRQREGTELQHLIEQRLDGISEQVVIIREKLPAILQAQKDRLRDKLNELQAEIDSERLEQEMVYLAQKSDVDEELDRLDTHITEVRRTLKQKGAIGRRLDFLMQELNREANTLSSKSIVVDTTQAAVEIKVLIEQMREQIQNIE